MIHAYNEIYLNTVMHNLAALFDLAINAYGLDPDEFALRFSKSNISKGIECVHPNYLAGKSPTEMLSELLEENVEYNRIPMNRSPEYWAGWVLAYTQWYLDKKFEEILNVIPFSSIVNLYNPYHKAPESKTVEKIRSMFPSDSALKQYRKKRNLSQRQLSLISGVKLRNIQCYEQRKNSILKAEAANVLALAKALDCSMEELLH